MNMRVACTVKQNAILNRIQQHFTDAQLRSPVLCLLLKHFDHLDCRIEISKKVNQGTIYPFRVNLLLDEELSLVHTACEAFISELSEIDTITINGGNSFFHSIELDRIELLYVGIDIREDFQSSSMRLWCEYKNVNIPDELKVQSSSSIKLINLPDSYDSLLVGYDFYFNGEYIPKLYFIYHTMHDNAEVKNELLQCLNKKVVYAMKLCNFTYMRMREGDQLFIYFCLQRVDLLLSFLDIKNIDKAALLHNDMSPYMIGLYYHEILAGKIKNYNLYYLVRCLGD